MCEIQIESVSSQRLANKIYVILQCTLLNGMVHKGQSISLPYSHELNMTIPIDEIEKNQYQKKMILIKVLCEDESDVDFLSSLDLEGEILSVK